MTAQHNFLSIVFERQRKIDLSYATSVRANWAK